MRQGVSKDFLKGFRRHHRGHTPYPIEKFLTSRLGLDWDSVYSEMSEAFDRRSNSGYEFFRSLDWYVKTNCWIGAETGTVYDAAGNQLYDEFYVHPHTGVLCYCPKKVWPEKKGEVTYVRLSEDKAYQKLEGIWFYTEFKKNPFYDSSVRWRLLSGGATSGKDHLYLKVCGEKYVITFKRQLGKKELKKNGLGNGRNQ